MNRQHIQSVEEFENWHKYEAKPVMSLDFETTSLNYLEMEFVGFSIYNGESAIYVSCKEALSYLGNMLQTGKWIFHNTVFDMKCCWKFCGTEPKDIWCSLVAAKIINENRDSYSLKTLAYEDLGIPLENIKKYNEVSDNTDSPEFIDYAINDSIWTYQLYQKQVSELSKQKLEYLMYEVEMPFQYVLRDLEINGVLVDKEKLEVLRDEVKEILHNLEVDMLAMLGKSHHCNINLFGEIIYESPINFNSDDQCISIIESLGVGITEITKPSKTFPKGKKSLNKDTKARIKGIHPFIDLLLRHKKLGTLYRNFILKAEEFMDEDGRIRTSYGLKRTGRLSSSQPNLQNLPNPKKEKLEFNHRELFIPAPGNVLVKADWSGQELRILAEVSKDDNMVAAFNKNYDLHLYTANRIFNLELPEQDFVNETPENTEAKRKYKAKRYQAKNGVNFPAVYDAFAKRIANDNKVSVEEAQRWLDEFNELYPMIKSAKKRSNNQLARYGYVTTLMGRRRRFPLYKSATRYEKGKMERQAFNVQIQGFAADTMKLAAIKMMPLLKEYGAKMVLVIHDEWIFEVPEDKAEEFAKVVKYVMEHSVCITVSLPVEVDIVTNYGA